MIDCCCELVTLSTEPPPAIELCCNVQRRIACTLKGRDLDNDPYTCRQLGCCFDAEPKDHYDKPKRRRRRRRRRRYGRRRPAGYGYAGYEYAMSGPLSLDIGADFHRAMVTVWNSLPEHIRQSTLKTFLLQQILHLAHYRQ